MPAISLPQIKTLLVESFNEWSTDQAPRLGAALSYYTVLSLAPLLILMIALAGLVFGDEAARGQLFGQIRGMVGSEGAEAIQTMVQNASNPGSGIVASIVGFLTLIFGASSVAAELKASLNVIWDVPVGDGGVKEIVKERSYALVVVLGCGFLLLVSLAVSSALAAAGTFVGTMLPLPEFVLQTLNFVVGLAVITGVFAVMFKYLPDAEVQWGDVLLGATLTSVLFSIGKLLIGLYLGKASIGSTYGAAGSLVIVLVWVYYSSQILFFGAEFTQVYAASHGSDPRRKKLQTAPVTPAGPLAQVSASGGTALPAAGDRTSGVFGSLIGSALAVTKIVRGIRR